MSILLKRKENRSLHALSLFLGTLPYPVRRSRRPHRRNIEAFRGSQSIDQLITFMVLFQTSILINER